MPSYVVRASRDAGSPYLIWSSIVDAPTYVFASRDELLQHLHAEDGRHHPGFSPNKGHRPEDRVERADVTGTSAIEPAGYLGWDDEEFIVMNGIPDKPENVWWALPRERLAAYATALLADDEPGAISLLVAKPFEER